VIFEEGRPRWRSAIQGICPQIDELGEFGDLCNEQPVGNEVRLGCEEARTGFLLWVFCYKTLLEGEYIDARGKSLGKPFPARLSSIGEPGGKQRVPTITLAVLVGYLQPYQHLMTNVLESHPSLTAGLSAANQVWEFCKQHKGVTLPGSVLLGDLEDATNWISHEVGTVHMAAFLRGMTPIHDTLTDYVLNAHTLLCCPLALEHDGYIFITCGGNAMGLPGTKATLHSLALSVDKMAEGVKDELPLKSIDQTRFMCAGDDIMKFGPDRVLRNHKIAAERYKVRPSADKWGIYQLGGTFCEIGVRTGGTCVTHPSQLQPGQFSFQVESVRTRLMSPEVKMATSDVDKNPAFGKGRQFGKELGYLGENQAMINRAVGFYLNNFRDYGDFKLLAALPTELGGFGFPLEKQTRLEWLRPVAKQLDYSLNYLNTPVGKMSISIFRKLGEAQLLDRGAAIDILKSEPRQWERAYLYTLNQVIDREAITFTQKHPRYWDQTRAIESRGYRTYDNLKTIKPYWQRVDLKPQGWLAAPMGDRLRRLEESFNLLEDYEDYVPQFEWNEQIMDRALRLTNWKEGLFYKTTDSILDFKIEAGHNHAGRANSLKYLYDTDQINLGFSQSGMSLKFRIPNKRCLFYPKAPQGGTA